jgi:hypothetical protein
MARVKNGDKWYYHPVHGPDLGWEDEAAARYEAGWYDSPDEFPKPTKNKPGRPKKVK